MALFNSSSAWKPSTGADVAVQCLIDCGVETVFCVTGAGNLALVDSMNNCNQVNVVFCHHEQAAVMAAQGYARVSGMVGVALVTTGGGAANALTGTLSAQLDSVPLLVLSGNESSFHIVRRHNSRSIGVQGFDSVSVYRPVTKIATRIMSTATIGSVLMQSWSLAVTGRPGAVFVDFPMDIQRSCAIPSRDQDPASAPSH